MVHDYYYCIGRQKKRTDCDLPYTPVEQVEQMVVDYYRHLQISPIDLEIIRTEVEAHIERTRSLNTREVARQRRRL